MLILQIEGLDVSGGLARLGGNQSLYLKLLRRFLDFASLPEQFAEQLALGDRSAAERLAHTLKGSAAGLGMEAVRAAAASLEVAARQGGPTDVFQVQLETVLSDMISRLRASLPLEERVPDQQADVEVTALLADLDARLGEFDVAAIELFEAHQDLIEATLAPARFRDLQTYLSNYALAEARATLRQAVAEREHP